MPSSKVPSPLVVLAFLGLSTMVHGAAFSVAYLRSRPATPPRVFDPTSPPLAGETLEVDPAAAEPGTEASEAAEAIPGNAPPAPPLTPGVATLPPRVPATHAPRPASPTAAAPAAAGGARPALFGAVGVRFATDLATTFTRAFPQAASADAVWSSVRLGSAGTADVALTLDDAGHLEGSAITGAPSPALRRGIERTLALLGPRAFTARGATTRLRVVARVGKDDVHDGLHGDVFALSGGSFSGDTGAAFFALPAAGGGRRIDVELRLVP